MNSNARFPKFYLAGSCAALLLLGGCPKDPDPSVDGSESETTGDGDGDPGDGDGDSGDGDGDSGDGDGDSGDGDGDGDTGECTDAGCPCDPNQPVCDMGLYCHDIDNVCTAPVCGDDELQPLEQCDDANVVDGDGCDSDCTFTEILYIDASYQNTCALIEGGRVRCWGYNGAGQLGYGHTDNIGDDETPADVGDVMLPEPGVELTMGDSHSCILMADMNVRCWGSGSSGQLGYGANENIGDDEFPSSILDVMVGGSVLEIDAGGSHSCARLENGKLRCWGGAFSGQLGYGNVTNIGDDEPPASAGDVPVGGAIVAQATGISHTCAILANGKIRCWGSGYTGQLGYGNTMTIGNMTTPAQAGDLSAIPMGSPENTSATALALGYNISCALYSGGEVLCWGDGFTGALGQGTTNAIGDNELPSTMPPISLPGAAIAITTGDSHVCALFDDHKALCWGANYNGQLGAAIQENIGDDELPSTIDPLLFVDDIKQIDGGGNHTCAITATNELYCWGVNGDGQLGYGHTDDIGDDESVLSAGPVQLF
jgi:cysteine-rich repeat protein